MTRSHDEWTRLFRKVGARDPEEWASCEVNEDLGNLVTFVFLRQMWNEIPASGDSAWLGKWMHAAREVESAKELVAACDRLIQCGASPGDVVTVIRGALGQFLFNLTYKLDDNMVQDEELQEAARWGLWEEDENDEPVRRIGCIHELVFSADPENDDEG